MRSHSMKKEEEVEKISNALRSDLQDLMSKRNTQPDQNMNTPSPDQPPDKSVPIVVEFKKEEDPQNK